MKVLIVGLRREHSHKIRKLYSSMAIDVLDDQMKHHKPVKNILDYDSIISLTKFTNHTTHEHYRKHPGYRMTTGSYSSVVNMLEALPC